MSTVDDRDALARYLRQRGEMGEAELLLTAPLSADAFTDSGRVSSPSVEDHSTSSMSVPRSAAKPAGAKAGKPDNDASRPGYEDLGYEDLKELARGCTRCRLAESRTQVVFSDGTPDARLMVVGEAPGQREDETGLPFVGPAGGLLDLLLGSVSLSRKDSVYICNVLKCRPPGNRNPLPDEIQCCSPFLLRQIELVSPEVILAVGTFAGQLLTGEDRPLGRLRGEVYSYQGVPLVVTYHPAALLRNPGWTRPTWDDLQLLRQVLDGS